MTARKFVKDLITVRFRAGDVTDEDLERAMLPIVEAAQDEARRMALLAATETLARGTGFATENRWAASLGASVLRHTFHLTNRRKRPLR